MFKRKKQREPVDEKARDLAWREFDKEQQREAFRGLGPGYGRIPRFDRRREKA